MSTAAYLRMEPGPLEQRSRHPSDEWCQRVRFYGGREGECPAQAPIDSPTSAPPRPPLSLRLLPAFLIPEFQLLGWMACSNCSWVDNIWRVAHSCPIVSFSPGWPLPGCEGLATRRPCCEYSARANNLLAGISSGSGAIIIIM